LVENTNKRGVVIYGSGGMGKSQLMSNCITQEMGEWALHSGTALALRSAQLLPLRSAQLLEDTNIRNNHAWTAYASGMGKLRCIHDWMTHERAKGRSIG
jgi:hypothetical protein